MKVRDDASTSTVSAFYREYLFRGLVGQPRTIRQAQGNLQQVILSLKLSISDAQNQGIL